MASNSPGSRKSGFWLAFKVVELRLRFVVVLAATGLGFAYWDTIRARYDKWARPAAVAELARPGIEFFCPMHPNVIGEEPASCPICGMPLSKRRRGEPARLPEGALARVTLTPGRVRQAGVRTVEVGYSAMAETLTTVGTVEYDERRLRRISSKIRGMARVEKLHVDFLGADVRAGQPMAELYGPELYQAVRELILARKRAGSSGDSSLDLVSLSTEKLKLMGVTQEQVDAILRAGKAEFSLPILAPIGGHVVRKDVVEGQYVAEGQTLFEVADLDVVWIKAQVFEGQLPLVRLGQRVEAAVGSAPGETFAGKVAYIPPHVDPATRAVEVRYEVENPGHRLRPGSFATVTLTTPIAETPLFRGRIAPAHAEHDAAPTVASQKTCPVTGGPLGSMGGPVATEAGGRMIWTCCSACPPKIHASPAKYLARLAGPPVDGVLAVPESAVIDTGTLTMVYVEVEPGVFEGRKVTLGPRSGDHFPVLEGLAPGENVVAQGAFLVDAESRLDPSTRPNPVAPAKSDGRSASAGGGAIRR